MVDLVRWLGEQLDEDERVAREASGSTVVGEPGNWRPSPAGDEWEAYAGEIEEELLVALRPGLPRPPEVMSGYWGAWASFDPTSDPGAGSSMPALTHAARHDPARVLREIEIDRELLAEYERLLRAHEAHQREAARIAEFDDDPIRRGALRREADYLPAMLHVVERWAKRKAAVYAERPGYREEWRP